MAVLSSSRSCGVRKSKRCLAVALGNPIIRSTAPTSVGMGTARHRTGAGGEIGKRDAGDVAVSATSLAPELAT